MSAAAVVTLEWEGRLHVVFEHRDNVDHSQLCVVPPCQGGCMGKRPGRGLRDVDGAEDLLEHGHGLAPPGPVRCPRAHPVPAGRCLRAIRTDVWPAAQTTVTPCLAIDVPLGNRVEACSVRSWTVRLSARATCKSGTKWRRRRRGNGARSRKFDRRRGCSSTRRRGMGKSPRHRGGFQRLSASHGICGAWHLGALGKELAHAEPFSPGFRVVLPVVGSV